MSSTWLKSLTCFSLIDFNEPVVAELGAALQRQPFTSCGSYDKEQHGFVPAFGLDEFVRKTEHFLWLQMKSERKVVPGAAVKRALKERIEEIETREARKVSKKEKKALKEEVTDELLADALSTESTVTIAIDTTNKRLLIGTASKRVVEKVLELLLKCIDGFQFERVDFGNTIAREMSSLLLGNEVAGFETDSTLVLKGPGTPASTIRFARHGLAAAEVAAHINAGMRPVELELGWEERVSFVLTDAFGLKKINYLDVVTSPFEEALPEDPVEVLDAMLLLQAGELSKLLGDLTTWFTAASQQADSERLAA